MNDQNDPTFEESLKAAETAGERLERGELTLEDSLQEYQRGVQALKECYRTLNRAQQRLETLNEELGVGGEVGASRAGGEGWSSAATSGPLKDVLQRLRQESGGDDVVSTDEE